MKKLKILYEDKYLLIVDKPENQLCIATNKEKEKTLYHEVYLYLKKKNQKVFIVHRLDKETSGIVVFAKNVEIKTKLQNNWNEYALLRKYIAIVHGISNEKGQIRNYLAESKNHIVYITDAKKGKLAITNYQKLDHNEKYSLLDISILTGRKNQIRVQLNNINNPIVGDKKYGTNKNKYRRMYLHANYLKLVHPHNNKVLEITSQLPNNFTLKTIE